ncbi:MAG: hypothetical protein IH820_03525 [Bacteroidetes bacterium]|nr:hypothetical protein [Bacteroidota bacterium]
MRKAALTERQETLLQHLDSVYLLAQAISPDAKDAAHFVEETFTQAFVTHPLNHTDHDDKRWLFHLLMHIRHEQVEFERLVAEEESPPGSPPEALHALRRGLAQHVADRALPAVLATLPDEQRLLLVLCDAEGLACTDAAYVLDLDAETACRRLEQARTAMRDALHADVSEREWQLLDQNLPDDWLRPTLRRTVEATFGPPPPTLRPAILKATPPTIPAATVASALDRSASPSSTSSPYRTSVLPSRRKDGPRWYRPLVVLLLILGIGAIGYVTSRSLEREPETNLITLAVRQADAVRPSIQTGSPEQAENFVRDELNWLLTLPTIDDAVLTGVGSREVAPGVTVPVFLYDDTLDETDGPAITLYVFSYALLDQHKERIQLEPEILRQIQDHQQFDLHDLGRRNALVWRNRDDIYVAVTPGDPEALRKRIVFPS